MCQKKSLFLLVWLLGALTFAPHNWAQGTAEDYHRAARLQRTYRKAFYNSSASYYWSNDRLFLTTRLHGKSVEQIVDPTTGEKKPFNQADRTESTTSLQPRDRWQNSTAGRNNVDITFVNQFEQDVRLFWVSTRGKFNNYGVLRAGESKTMSTFTGHCWVADFKPNDIAGIFIAATTDCEAVFDPAAREKVQQKRGRAKHSATRENQLIIRQHNVWLRNHDADAFQLTTDGSKDDRYLRPFHYSDNGKRALVFRESNVSKRKIPLVESTPKDQIQPKIKWINYVKPGDPLPQRFPSIVDLTKQKRISVDEALFDDSWSIQFQRWSSDNRLAYVLYNRRGHQQLALRSIDAETGEVKDIVNETSQTFVDYSQKTMLHWLDEEEQILWASERDGWNHLYRIDARSGQVINQVTGGPWVVRKINWVDHENDVVWFTAMGIYPDQDPYHHHLARVNFDGSDLTIITSADGNHQWEFSPDHRYLVDKWSRVDQPAIWELLRASDGKKICQLWEHDVRQVKEAGYESPVRFEALGRDQKTKIFGYIVKPSNFDPLLKYPIIEAIYAGPHDHHVEKSFGLQPRVRMLTELGFVVVRIDGMGTNWRSKAFHDVCWQNLSDGGFPDRIAWIKSAAAQFPWMDISKVGIFGGSAGGQNALAALLHHGNFYHVAVSDCGCHDNRMDKIWWNEAWMGKMGPHYQENSNVTHAHKLTGDLMLTVGEMDSNVDPASTMQVVDALIRANKDFDLMVVPGRGHGVGEIPYLVRRRQDFFVRKLLRVEPRNTD